MRLPHAKARAYAVRCDACHQRAAASAERAARDAYAQRLEAARAKQPVEQTIARVRYVGPVFQVMFWGESRIAQNWLTVRAQKLRLQFEHDQSRLVGGKVRYIAESGEVVALYPPEKHKIVMASTPPSPTGSSWVTGSFPVRPVTPTFDRGDRVWWDAGEIELTVLRGLGGGVVECGDDHGMLYRVVALGLTKRAPKPTGDEKLLAKAEAAWDEVMAEPMPGVRLVTDSRVRPGEAVLVPVPTRFETGEMVLWGGKRCLVVKHYGDDVVAISRLDGSGFWSGLSAPASELRRLA